MKKPLYLVICLICFKSFSQEAVKNIDLGISKNAEVFQIVEEDKKQVSLFFSAKTNVLSVRFDEKFNVIDSLKTEKPSSKNYDDIVGYSVSGNKYYAYWSGVGELLSQCFDFETHKVISETLPIALEGEKIIKRITVDNVFYIISVLKKTSVLSVYVIKEGTIEKKRVDMSSYEFFSKDNKSVTLWDIVSGSTYFEPAYVFQTISTESPPSLTFSAYKRKLYILKNKLLFTLDNNTRFTQTFTIDLTDFKSSTKMFPQTSSDNVYYDNTNSFVLNDKMIQIKINPDLMKLAVKDMQDRELKNFFINNQEISFKNSDIYQENGSVKDLRILGKSSQLLRKINGLYPSVSLYESNQNIYMILGGVSEVKQNNVMMYGGGGMAGMAGMSGVFIGMALSSNYSLNNLNSYKQRKVVYINCLFDLEFNHLKGEIKNTSFDKLRAFSETKEDLIAPVLFKLNSNLYYGGYDRKTGNYSFYKFND